MSKVSQQIDDHVVRHAPQGDDYLSVTVTRGHARKAVHNALVPIVVLAVILIIIAMLVYAALPHAPAGLVLLGI